MRSTLDALLLSASASSGAFAQDIVFGPGPGSFDFGIYEVSASAPEVVGTTSSGTPLVGFTMTVTNVSGNPDLDLNGVFGVTVGSNGALHHEQNLPGLTAAGTPLASTFTDNGLQRSAVDSHLLPEVGIALPFGVPDETAVATPSGVAPEVGGQTGFGGVLIASYGFSTTDSSVDLVYLVIEGFDGSAVDFSFQTPFFAEDLAGRFVLAVPEPASALLAGAALLGFAARRY